jgi:hypothetical protein
MSPDGREEKRLSFPILPHVFLEPYSRPQESKCEETSTVGSLPRIHLQITIFLVTLTTREQLLGFFKVASIKNGGRLLHSCGYMANVRSFHSLQLNTSQTCIFKRALVKASFGS